MQALLSEISNCTICAGSLPHGVRPVVSASPLSKILVIGQAPGRAVHKSGVPWDDKSGDNLRAWLGVDLEQFYDPNLFALMPMGFCYPGTGVSGDLPPKKECAPHWHERLLIAMPNIEMTLLIGSYAQRYYLQDCMKENLTQTVEAYKEYIPDFFPLPHPSPRNNIWKARHQWFEKGVLPELKGLVHTVI